MAVLVVVLVEIPTLETASPKGFDSTSCSCDCPESESESVIIYTVLKAGKGGSGGEAGC